MWNPGAFDAHKIFLTITWLLGAQKHASTDLKCCIIPAEPGDVLGCGAAWGLCGEDEVCVGLQGTQVNPWAVWGWFWALLLKASTCALLGVRKLCFVRLDARSYLMCIGTQLKLQSSKSNAAKISSSLHHFCAPRVGGSLVVSLNDHILGNVGTICCWCPFWEANDNKPSSNPQTCHSCSATWYSMCC